MPSNAPRHLSHFHGGLKLPGNKAMSTVSPIVKAQLPSQLIIPAHQHIGESGELLVKTGDKVLKGQMLTLPKAYVSAPVHASSSGVITDIGLYPAPHPSSLSTQCIVIECDGKDEWIKLDPAEDYLKLSPSDLRNKIRHAGIVGLGGAAFPTSVKLNPGPDHAIETLIINGVECEPYISCDDMLMRERADEIISGVEILLHTLSAKTCFIAIEDNKPEALDSLKTALKKSTLANIHIISIPTLYPSGGEKQLIKILTGKEVPSDGLPLDISIIVQNVGTATAIHRAIHFGEPLLSRIITITGEGVEKPQNMDVLIGTRMAELIEQSGGYNNRADLLVMGGPMMGFTLNTDELPIIKGCNCLLVESAEQRVSDKTMPCIRCSECARVCPASLLPQQLYWHASSKNFDQVQDYHLFDCIECGCCAYVCPSHIPLVQYYRFAKTEIWNQERERVKSDHARDRHDFREARLAREKKERDERLRKKKEMLEKKKQAEASKANDSDKDEIDPKKAAIAAAMERAKNKKQDMKTKPENTDHLTTEQQKQIDEADKRRQVSKTE
jgi:Na+-translocating ferredoxin:NAD+ oxidoreductase subunit C